MKSVLTGIIAAALIAALAGFVLNSEVQRPTSEAFTTSGVRL